MLTIWGLKSCDTCKKAMKWLSENEISHEVKDVRADGIPAESLTRWATSVGWESLVNKASTTWRGLADEQKDGLDEQKALDLIMENPTLLKRPVFEQDDQVLVGFKAAQQDELVKSCS